MGPVGTLLPGEDGPGLCPIGLTVGLWPVAAKDPTIALSPVEGWKGIVQRLERRA